VNWITSRRFRITYGIIWFGGFLMRLIDRAFAVLFLSALSFHGSFAQKLVDPDKVAPEFRVAAEKRRAEQIKILQCSHKADEAKVLPRDRTANIQHCLDEQ
jgi:hypothetical protein